MIAMGNFMIFMQYIAICSIYTQFVRKNTVLQGEKCVIFIVYPALIELQELYFRVISG